GAGGGAVAGRIGPGAGEGVFLGRDNGPHQGVVVGPPGPMAAVEAELQARRVLCERLPFRRPYHTPLFAPYLGPLHAMYADVPFQLPQTPLYSCSLGQPFPADPDAIRRLTVEHWASPVEFTRLIRNLHADGVRLFVESG